MPLHKVARPGDPGIEDVYATAASDQRVAKYRLPEHTSSAQEIYSLVHDELLLDGNSRQNLATFCTTWAEPEAHKLMDESIDKNMIDKDEYPQTAEIEKRCVHMIADLWHAPGAWKTVGCSTTGSSEACMLGGLALKWQWRKRRIAAGKPYDKPNFVCGPVQVCWEKFARYFDVEIRQVPLQGDALGLRPEDLRQYCDENTIGVIPTLGVTFTGIYEPVAALARALDELAARNRPEHPDPRRCGQRRIHRAVHPAGTGVGLPHRAGEVDQRLGPQIRPGAAWRGLGDLARPGGAAGGADLQRRLPGRPDADLRVELQPAGRADHRAVL